MRRVGLFSAGADSGQAWFRKLAAITGATAGILFWLVLYREPYPPRLGLLLAGVAVLLLVTLPLLHRIHRGEWPGIAHFGFVISETGLVLLIIGGAAHAFGLPAPFSPTQSQSAWLRFIGQVLSGPQTGWGLLTIGLIPIGFGAIKNRLSLPVQLLLPLGSLWLLGIPLKAIFGEVGGLPVIAVFGAGWVVVASLLLSGSKEQKAA